MSWTQGKPHCKSPNVGAKTSKKIRLEKSTTDYNTLPLPGITSTVVFSLPLCFRILFEEFEVTVTEIKYII